MRMKVAGVGFALIVLSIVIACSSGVGSSDSSSGGGSTCSLTGNTTETTSLSAYGCPLLVRDTASCQASRTAQGLTGYWLKFSCRVTLTKSGSNVIITTDSRPDYKSNYFQTSDACYASFSNGTRHANPNRLATKSMSITVPLNPTPAGSNSATPDGVVGVALNGVAIYDNTAAPGDDIYQEQFTFDKCDGHPDVSSTYHYHDEPSSITQADDGFIGVLRDGFPIYGRIEYGTGGAVASGLDAAGGKSGKTVDSPSVNVYHYHANAQTDGTYTIYFLTKGYYHGTPGTCTGC